MSHAPFSRTATAARIRAFGECTRDLSQIHLDADFARSCGFPATIAHGLLTASWALEAVSQRLTLDTAGSNSKEQLSEVRFRLSRVVNAEDRLRFEVGPVPSADGYAFEGFNARDESVVRGEALHASDLSAPPEAYRKIVLAPQASQAPDIFYAEDLVECGPQGATDLSPVVVSDIEGFEGLMNDPGPDGDVIRAASPPPPSSPSSSSQHSPLPPMFNFCLGFSDFLRALLALPMPETGSAGHVGDAWMLHRPVARDEPLQTRFRTLSATPSRSQPTLSLVRFGLQRVDANERVVLSGETVMMISRRP